MKRFILRCLGFAKRLIRAVLTRCKRLYKKVFSIRNSFKKRSLPKTIKKVSVVIPNYNYARFLEARVDSILAQTYPIYELIILDDASSDDSQEVIANIVKRLKNRDNPLDIRVITNKKNSGNVFKQWDKAFAEAKGDYLWIAEADDLSSKYFLNMAMKGFNGRKNIIISCVETETIDENGKRISADTRSWSEFPCKDFCMNGKDFIAKHLAIKNTIVNVSGVVFRKDSKVDFHKILSEASQFNNTGDWYFYEKILTKGDIAYNAMPLNSFRIHSSSVTHSKSRAAHYNEILKTQEICARDVALPEKIVQQKQAYLIKQKDDWWLSGDEVFYDRLDNIKSDELLISVIIPAYNTAEYLDRCIRSALDGLSVKAEIIVVDDGSTDNSKEVVERLMAQEQSVKYFYQAHSGQSAAKQNGLNHAKGKYIIFLDSDDYVEAGAYELMLKKALREKSDIVCCDFCIVYQDGNRVLQKAVNKDNSVPILTGLADCALMASLCNKLVKREIYQGIQFPIGATRYEDVAVAPLILAKAKNISYLESPLYNYVQREKSVNSEFDESVYDIFEIVKKCMDDLKTANPDVRNTLEQSLIIHQIIAPILWRIAALDDPSIREKEIKKFCTKYNSYGFNSENGENVIKYLLRSGNPGLIDAIHRNDYHTIANMI